MKLLKIRLRVEFSVHGGTAALEFTRISGSDQVAISEIPVKGLGRLYSSVDRRFQDKDQVKYVVRHLLAEISEVTVGNSTFPKFAQQ